MKDQNIRVRLTVDQKAKLRAISEAEGRPISQVVRYCILQYLNQCQPRVDVFKYIKYIPEGQL